MQTTFTFSTSGEAKINICELFSIKIDSGYQPVAKGNLIDRRGLTSPGKLLTHAQHIFRVTGLV